LLFLFNLTNNNETLYNLHNCFGYIPNETTHRQLKKLYEVVKPTSQQLATLPPFPWDLVDKSDTMLDSSSRDAVLDALRLQMESAREVNTQSRTEFIKQSSYDEALQLERLLKDGFEPMMLHGFQKSGLSYRQSKSYRNAKVLCNNELGQLIRCGRAVAFDYERLKKRHPDVGALFHLQPLVHTAKSGSFKGRTCLNASYPGGGC
jgi:hypothetical protein